MEDRSKRVSADRRFRLHLFTDEVDWPEEMEIMMKFLNAGLDYLHLRKPSYSPERLRGVLDMIPEQQRRHVVLHDYPELALEYGCGFQINRRTDRWPDEFKSLYRDIATLAASCHSFKEIDEIKSRYDLDFVTLSPVFDSISKSGYHAGFRTEDLSGHNLEGIVALGGVVSESLPRLREIGFGGAAVLGDVWHNHKAGAYLKYLRMRNFPLQFVTDGHNMKETVEQAVNFIEGGGRWVQVRMKEARKEEVRETLQELLPICEEYCATLLVDDHYDLARYCHGVHLGQQDAPVSEVREKLSPEEIIGLTINSPEHIERSRSALPDYYGVGPFRFTSTKKRLAPVLGLDGYRRLASEMPLPFVAIGGIRPEDVTSILETGASGVAVSSAVTRAEDPVEATASLMRRLGYKFSEL